MNDQERIEALENALRNCISTLKDIENLPARWPILRNLTGWMSVETRVITTYCIAEETMSEVEQDR